MNSGKETWKWGLVVILLAIFLITANQAYQHLANQEEYAPPDDYLKGDSWDLEHNGGPGAGQPIETKSNINLTSDDNSVKVNKRLSTPKPIVFDDKSNWNQATESNSEKSDSNTKEVPEKVNQDSNKNIEKSAEQQTNQVIEQSAEKDSEKTEESKVEQPQEESIKKPSEQTEKTEENNTSSVGSPSTESEQETLSTTN